MSPPTPNTTLVCPIAAGTVHPQGNRERPMNNQNHHPRTGPPSRGWRDLLTVVALVVLLIAAAYLFVSYL
jgi:hypothetical protein